MAGRSRAPLLRDRHRSLRNRGKNSHHGPGHPPKDWYPYKTVYKIAADVQQDAAAIDQKKDKESCFVVATTLDESDQWSDEAILTEYKKQHTVERRFPVLKDPKRVEGLGYLLVMALLVYSVIERRARQALRNADDPMELTGGPTRPQTVREHARDPDRRGTSDS